MCYNAHPWKTSICKTPAFLEESRDRRDESRGRQRELRMLDALATLVMDDKLAIVCKGHGRRPTGELGVDFVVCVNQVSQQICAKLSFLKNAQDAIGGEVTVIRVEPQNVVKVEILFHMCEERGELPVISHLYAILHSS
jgi:hypothetical protein